MAKGRKKKPGGRGGRRSRKPSKDETVEVRTPTEGDNSKLALPAPEDYEHHMKTIRGMKDKVATASSLLRHAKEAANKCSPGLAASIEETLKIERENDPIKLRTRFEMLGLGLKQINSSIQLNVFDTLAGDQEDLVYKRGFDDGKAGRTAQNDYPEGSNLHSLYAKGWRHGTADNLGVSPEEADRAVEQEQKQAA